MYHISLSQLVERLGGRHKGEISAVARDEFQKREREPGREAALVGLETRLAKAGGITSNSSQT